MSAPDPSTPHTHIHLVYRSGDIASLQVEAVVNPTNESLTDKNPISTRLYELAGPELRDECKSQIGSELGYFFCVDLETFNFLKAKDN